MRRSIGSTSISFGLVTIGVKLYSAAEHANDISFNLVHSKECPTKLKQKYVCPVHDVEVPYNEQHKGYEYGDRFVVFDKDELKALDQSASNSIDVKQFVPLDSIDRRYVEKTYYLGPDKGMNKAYVLFSTILLKTNRVAIGMYAARGKSHLVGIRALANGVLAMEQMYFEDEIRSANEIDTPEEKANSVEITLAEQLVSAYSVDAFDGRQYKNVVKERVAAAIEQKIQTGQPIEQEAPQQTRIVVDLITALTASLKQTEASKV